MGETHTLWELSTVHHLETLGVSVLWEKLPGQRVIVLSTARERSWLKVDSARFRTFRRRKRSGSLVATVSVGKGRHAVPLSLEGSVEAPWLKFVSRWAGMTALAAVGLLFVYMVVLGF